MAGKVREGPHALVFCHFKGSQREIADALANELGEDAVRRPDSVSGVTDAIHRRFRSPDGAPLARVVPDNLSGSIDLDGGRPVLAHHDLTWNPARLDQRWGRVVRVQSGFETPADQYVPVLELPADYRLFHTMANRRRMGERLLPTGASFDEGDGRVRTARGTNAILAGRG